MLGIGGKGVDRTEDERDKHVASNMHLEDKQMKMTAQWIVFVSPDSIGLKQYSHVKGSDSISPILPLAVVILTSD